MSSRHHVLAGRLSIAAKEVRIPKIGTKGTRGVLKGRGISGRLRRRIHTPAQTITNASRVPIFTRTARSPIGISEANAATQIPTTSEEIHGVRNREWIAPAHFGSKPSRDIE